MAAKPSDATKGNTAFYHPDHQNIPEFADEFDAIPIPDAAEIAGRLKCETTNENYIKSSLPMQHVGLQDIYTQMAKRQWKQPFVRRDGLALHAAKGMLAIGARRALGANPSVQDVVRPAMPRGGATDWDLISDLVRVNAYAFRGDKRQPRIVKEHGGFHPPSTRTDAGYMTLVAKKFVQYMKDRFTQDVTQSEVEEYIRGKGPAGKVLVEYEIWRAILKGEELHIGRMTQNEFLKGYVSTSRDVAKAYGFMNSASAGGKDEGLKAVYALHTEGGFLLPPKGKNVHATTDEAEIAHPGPLPWSKVKAFRIYQTREVAKMHVRTFQGSEVLFVRKGFRGADPKGAQQVIWSLASLPAF